MTIAPKVFVSYSWSSKEHVDWTINLAERLVSDGVDVVIDKWDLREGHDKYDFMESMVKSNDVQKVLIVLDKRYAEKADERSGGVGTETQIISGPVYENVSQEKFIPVIAERDEDGIPFTPTYLKNRIYIDLSEDNSYEENYEKLLRNIYQRPAHSKPQIGRAPSYLFDSAINNHKTSSILRTLESNTRNGSQKNNPLLRDFLDEFYSSLLKYQLSFDKIDDIGKVIYENLNSLLPLRNEFISFLTTITKSEYIFDVDILIKFFERIYLLKYPTTQRGSWSNYEYDNFRFITHELFLYSIAISLKHENYTLIEELLYSSYFINDKYHGDKDPKTFTIFYNYIDSLDSYYRQTYSKNFLSTMADFMVKRLPENFPIDTFVDADLLCYYVGSINQIRWFPITYIYKHEGARFELFERLSSARHFEKIKRIFDVDNVDQLNEKIIKFEIVDRGSRALSYSGTFHQIEPIYKIINLKTVATKR